MAWNDPFETLVETIVDELGTFLMNRGDLAAYEVARTQEVCRDFCNFLCKDVHKATSQDYAVYLQMHALTAEAEVDYGHMLADIRSYCEQNGGATPAPAQASMAVRRRVKTNEMDNSAEHVQDMFAMGESGSFDMRGGSQAFDMRRASQAFDMRRASQSLDLKEFQGAATPPKPLDAVLTQSSGSHESLSERFGKFDFSVDNVLADDLNGVTRFPPSDPNIGANDPNATFFQGYGATAREEEQSFDSNIESGQHAKYELNQPSGMASIDGDLTAEEQGNELLRGVNGVEYNFSHNSIRKMRDFEKQQRKNEMVMSNAIDYKLVGNFRSFVFERKFVIDTPLPVVDEMTAYRYPFVWRYLIPLAPTLVLLALAIALSTIHFSVGLVFGFLALVMLIFEIPNVKPANQTTPQATLVAYLNARSSRCYGLAMSMLAQPKEEQKEILFHAIWDPELPWPKAFLARFKSQPIPEFRVPLGSETKNSMVLLYNNEEDYWLVPMVRLDTKWYITDPTLGRHTIVKEES